MLKHTEIIDRSSIPKDANPKDVVNLTLLAVKKVGDPKAEEFKKLANFIYRIKEQINHLFSEFPLSYYHLGPIMGDEKLALRTIGLGHLLDVWQIACPDISLQRMPEQIKKQAAEQGFIEIL